MPNWLYHLKSLRTQYIKLPSSKPLSSTGHFALSSYDRMSKLSFPLPASAGIWYTTFSYPGGKNIRQWWWKAASQTAAETGGCYSWIASAICWSPAPYISLFHFINVNILVSSQQLCFLSHILLVDLKAMRMDLNFEDFPLDIINYWLTVRILPLRRKGAASSSYSPCKKIAKSFIS